MYTKWLKICFIQNFDQIIPFSFFQGRECRAVLIILYLSVILPNVAVNMRYKSTLLNEAELVLVKHSASGNYFICEVEKIKVDKNQRDDDTQSSFSRATEFDLVQESTLSVSEETLLSIGHESIHIGDIGIKKTIKCIKYMHCKYIYNLPFNAFYPLTGLDDESPLKISNITINGLKAEQVQLLQKIYGSNETKLIKESYFEILCKNILDIFYGFQTVTLTFWLFGGYYYYSSGIVLIIALVLIIAMRTLRCQSDRICSDSENHYHVTVIRNGCEYYVSHEELVPGDVVVMNKSTNYITFDGIVLEGTLTVDTSLLTGLTTPFNRYPEQEMNLQKRIEKLTLNEQTNSVFNGTFTIPSQNTIDCLALVVNIGFSTDKGQKIRKAQEPDRYAYPLSQDSRAYFVFLMFLGTIALFISLLLLLWFPENPLQQSSAIISALRLVTLVIPPSLPVGITIAFLWSTKRLNRQLIVTRKFRRNPVAGKVLSVIFDKTGTLTKNILNYIGHCDVLRGKDQNDLSDLDTSNDIINQDIVYLMASCHSLTIKSLQSAVHTIDKSMFQVTDWYFSEKEGENIIVKNTHFGALEEHKLIICERSPFHSDKKMQSVVTYIERENRYAYYVKGSPTKILECCIPESIPSTTKERLEAYTKHGYIVIAMAYQNVDSSHAISEDLKNNMIFLGIVVFEDTIADGSKETIESLKIMKFNNLMCTGDNIDTAICVARKVGILQQKSEIGCMVVQIKAVKDGIVSMKVSACDYDTKSPYDLPSAWGEIRNSTQYVIDGESFEVLDNFGGTELDRILKSGKVFANMKSNQKKNLVQLFTKKGHQTCMVGDGSNDNEALQAADVGLSLKSSESGLTASHYSTTNDIRSVPVLLNEGRTIDTQILTIFMFTACNSVLGMSSEAMMYSLFYELSEGQWIYMDLFLVLGIDLMLGYNESKNTTQTSRQTKPFFNSSRLLSMFCFSCVCVAFQIGLLFYTKSQDWYTQKEIDLNNLTEGSYESTYVFILLIFQLTFPAIVYTMKHEPIYHNPALFGMVMLFYGFNSFISEYNSEFISESFELALSPSVWFRCQILLFAFANLAMNIFMELILLFCGKEENKEI